LAATSGSPSPRDFHAALRVGISAQDAAQGVLLGCSALCARFSEFALTKVIVVALTLSGGI
jgi:hypothetical protein